MQQESFHRRYYRTKRGRVTQLIFSKEYNSLNHFIIRRLYDMQNEAVRILIRPPPSIIRLSQSANRRSYDHVVPIAGVLDRSIPVPPFSADVLCKTLGVMVLYLRVMSAYERPVLESDLQDIEVNVRNVNVFIEHLLATGHKVNSIDQHFAACLKRAMKIAFPNNALLHEMLRGTIRQKIKNLKVLSVGEKSSPKPPLMVII